MVDNKYRQLKFEHFKQNTKEELKRLAEFLDVKDTDPLLQDIAEKCSFNSLQTAEKSAQNDETMSDIMNSLHLKKNPTVYRKGEKENRISRVFSRVTNFAKMQLICDFFEFACHFLRFKSFLMQFLPDIVSAYCIFTIIK